MYTDSDSILFGSSCDKNQKCNPNEEAWISRIYPARLNREDLVVIYGIWADDAARAGFPEIEKDIHI